MQAGVVFSAKSRDILRGQFVEGGFLSSWPAIMSLVKQGRIPYEVEIVGCVTQGHGVRPVI